MSSMRSRSGGIRIASAPRRAARSARKPEPPDCVGGAVRLVAARMRASMRRARVPPTGISRRSCVNRSSFVCSSGAMSPISSRNSVPPSASSMMPAFGDSACECAPRT